MKLAIILGSTRPGRHSAKLAEWVVNNAKGVEGAKVELLDLQDYPLPFFDEEASPRFNPERHPNEAAKKWLAKLEEFEAYIIVTPEYNHSIPAVLKNALDYIDWQVKYKPFAIVSHGSAGGARAASHLKHVISEIRAVVIPTNLALTMRVSETFDENGTASEEVAERLAGPSATLQALLAELEWFSDALMEAKTKTKKFINSSM
ncbi:MAG TPA: NAD(P)H-dependent oxidoreductase [Candidatus Saccharimonadales bacterium]|nr:NAD(P)H-dependent oxidoreductase [Candidatus Saccharimonadales bacterium]